MLSRVVLAAAASIFLSSCSSNKIKLTEAEIQDYRGPSSIIDGMEQKFQAVMQNPSSIKANFLDRYLKIGYRTEGEVLNYERELDSAIARRKSDPLYSFTPQASPSYSRLMQLRYLRDAEHELIKHVYGRLLQTSTDVNSPPVARNQASNLIGNIHESLRKLSDADRLQTLDLVDSLREIAKEYHGASLPRASGRMPAVTTTSWSSVEEAYARFNTNDISKFRIKYQKETLKKAKIVLTSGDIALEPIQQPVPQSDRAPSSEKYAPGTGTYGNILGLSFPTGLFAFTYDDGPNLTSTVELLNLLHSNNTPATLFWLTQNVIRFPSSIELAKNYNFPIQNHSWSHPQLTKLDDAGLDHEINEAVAVAQEKIGVQPVTGTSRFRFFRCPYGACYAPASPKIRARIANLNLIHAYWTVDSLDWNYTKDPDRVFGLVTKGMMASGRGVVLMHDIHSGTVEVTRKLLAWIKSQNAAGPKIRLATLNQAVDEYNSTVVNK